VRLCGAGGAGTAAVNTRLGTVLNGVGARLGLADAAVADEALAVGRPAAGLAVCAVVRGAVEVAAVDAGLAGVLQAVGVRSLLAEATLADAGEAIAAFDAGKIDFAGPALRSPAVLKRFLAINRSIAAGHRNADIAIANKQSWARQHPKRLRAVLALPCDTDAGLHARARQSIRQKCSIRPVHIARIERARIRVERDVAGIEEIYRVARRRAHADPAISRKLALHGLVRPDLKLA